MRIRRTAAVLTSVATLTFGGVAVATPASAQQTGLVNVDVDDITVIGGDVIVSDNEVLSRNNVGVGVAAGIAAQVCGLQAQVGVIAQQIARQGDFECTNDAGTQRVRIDQAQ